VLAFGGRCQGLLTFELMWKNLIKVDELKRRLGEVGVRPKRAAGQNFLVCESVIEAIIAAAKKGPQRVTELGAGAGVLTAALLENDMAVRAIERDERLVALVEQMTEIGNKPRLDMVLGDLKEERWDYSEPYQLIGNIPYQLSGLIIRKLTQLENAPQQAILLVQKEVGQRMMASIGDMQLLALAVQLWGGASLIKEVPANCFWPVPKVDSRLMLLIPRDDLGLTVAEREHILDVAGHFFRGRRKQMGGMLRRRQRTSAGEAERILRSVDINPQQRPQEIDLARWIRLGGVV